MLPVSFRNALAEFFKDVETGHQHLGPTGRPVAAALKEMSTEPHDLLA